MRQKALVIGADPQTQDTLRQWLSSEQIEVQTCQPSEIEASAAFSHVILLHAAGPADVDLCGQIKSAGATAAIPVLLITPTADPDLKLRGLHQGAADCLPLPLDRGDVLARVRTALRAKQLMDLLANRAMIDGVTTLWTCAYLERRLSAELSLANRGHHQVSCIIVEIDGHAELQERLGHPFGDRLLGLVGQALISECRTEDVVCRCGPAQFAILTPNVGIVGASALAERLRLRIGEESLPCGGQPQHIKASLGVSGLASSSPATLLSDATQCLRLAQQRGGDRVVRADCEQLERELAEPASAIR